MRHAPRLILREVGYADAEIDAMIASGITIDGGIDKQQ
jgi:hypothetical protein